VAWALVLAVAVVGAWLFLQRRPRLPRITVADYGNLPAGGARPVARSSGERSAEEQMLLEAFRADEMSVPEDVDRVDRAMLVRILSVLATYSEAHEAVLWKRPAGPEGELVAEAWSRSAEPPALGEQDRALVELAVEDQGLTFNPSGPHLRVMALGIPVFVDRGAVSIHFTEPPTLTRAELEARLRTMAPEVGARYELLCARMALASRNKRLRKLIWSAITLQGTRDPVAHEEIVVRDARVVTRADWAVLVRGRREDKAPTLVQRSDHTPGTLVPNLAAHRNTMVGDTFSLGQERMITDTRPAIDAGEALFDATPVPAGTRSLLIVPVRRSPRDPCIGVVVLGRGPSVPFDNGDLASARELATIAAGALETAWAWQDAALNAKTDQLTGLPNRRAFEEEFARMIAETDRYGKDSALVIVDVDFFKKVNDSYGHEAGDQVLKAVGTTLLAVKRSTDKVARLGGEELAILLFQTDRQGAVEAAERCRKAIEALSVRTAAGDIRVTASFGVAMYTPRSQAAGSLFDRADQALYAAKHGGRNRVVLAPD
jgi:diguanylate cyclase (GGDEF)-like protein